MINGLDASNYTGILTAAQIQTIRDTGQSFAIQGCQSESIARANIGAFKAMGISDLDVYADVLRRVASTIQIAKDFGLGRVWLDFEPGCFENISELRQAVDLVQGVGLEAGIYTGRWCWPASQTGFSDLKLWHAAYETPDFEGFVPYGGWTRPFMWQFSSKGLPGLNVDLNVKEDAAPVPTPPAPVERVVDGVGLHFDTGETQQIWPVFGPIVGG